MRHVIAGATVVASHDLFKLHWGYIKTEQF
jgi:hypothetical protein